MAGTSIRDQIKQWEGTVLRKVEVARAELNDKASSFIHIIISFLEHNQ